MAIKRYYINTTILTGFIIYPVITVSAGYISINVYVQLCAECVISNKCKWSYVSQFHLCEPLLSQLHIQPPTPLVTRKNKCQTFLFSTWVSSIQPQSNMSYSHIPAHSMTYWAGWALPTLLFAWACPGLKLCCLLLRLLYFYGSLYCLKFIKLLFFLFFCA